MFQPLSEPGAFSFPKPPLQHTALGGSNKFRPHRKCWGQTCPFQPLACSGINLSLVLSWQLVVLLRTVPKYKSPDILQPDEHSVAFHKDCLWRILVLFGLASLTYFTVRLKSNAGNVTMLRTRHARCTMRILWLLWSGQVVHRSQGHEGSSLPSLTTWLIPLLCQVRSALVGRGNLFLFFICVLSLLCVLSLATEEACSGWILMASVH